MICAAIFLNCAFADYPTLAGTTVEVANTITVNFYQADTASWSGLVTANFPYAFNVMAMAGVSTNPQEERTIYITTLDPVYFSHKIINMSNAFDSVSWDLLYDDDGWDYAFILDENNDGLHQETETTEITGPINLEAQTSYNFFLMLAPAVAQIVPGSVSTGIKIETITGNIVAYTGWNDVFYGGAATINVSDNIDAESVARTGLKVTAYFEGYFNYQTLTQQPITINVQFRPVQNIDAGASYNMALDEYGQTTVMYNDLPMGNFYICIRQYVEDLPLGVNHVGFVSSENIMVTRDVITTINISDSLDTDSTFIEAYLPVKTRISPMTDIHGKYQIKGGDSNADNKINVVDIVAWENQSASANAQMRSKNGWTEKANYNGDDYISGADFSVWNKNKSQYIPLPEAN